MPLLLKQNHSNNNNSKKNVTRVCCDLVKRVIEIEKGGMMPPLCCILDTLFFLSLSLPPSATSFFPLHHFAEGEKGSSSPEKEREGERARQEEKEEPEQKKKFCCYRGNLFSPLLGRKSTSSFSYHFYVRVQQFCGRCTEYKTAIFKLSRKELKKIQSNPLNWEADEWESRLRKNFFFG